MGPVIIWFLKGDGRAILLGSDQEELRRDIEVAKIVEDGLEKVRGDLGADRAWIAKFHNGEHYLRGPSSSTSVKKLSIAYEASALGLNVEYQTISGLLVTQIPTILQNIMDEGEAEISKETAKYNPTLQLILKNRGVKFIRLFALKDIREQLVGILGLDYYNVPREMTEKEQMKLEIGTLQLMGYVFYEEGVPRSQWPPPPPQLAKSHQQ